MPATTEEIVKDSSDVPAAGFFDPSSHELVAAKVTSVTRDATTGKLYGTLNVTPIGPTTSLTQAANTVGATVIKATPGTLWSATVTTLGTAALSIYDNATTGSGTILLTIPASAAVGTIYNFTNGAPAANGITSNGVSNCPAVTIYFS